MLNYSVYDCFKSFTPHEHAKCKLGIDNFGCFITSPNEEIPGLKWIIDFELIPDENTKNCINVDCKGSWC